MKKIFSLFAAVLFAGSMMAEPLVLFHESFGDNSSSARAWSDDYADQSGVAAVYANVVGYTIVNAKQSKNTVGSVKSGLTSTTSGGTGYVATFEVGPLSVADYSNLAVSYDWKAASLKATYYAKLYYKTAADAEYTEVEGTGNGATSFVTRSFSLPAAAQVATLYLKAEWCTSNTNGVIDEFELTGEGDAPVVAVEKPVIAGDACFQNEIEVSLDCKTEGAKIYYTLDGSEPTASSTAYSAAFKLTASATVKAIAIKGDDKSEIAEKAFTAYPTSFNCEDAAAAALSVSADKDLYACGLEFSVKGYVTKIETEYSDKFHNISFWIADAADGGEVLEAFRAACASEAAAPKVGNYVEVTGQLTKYGTTPEFAAGCTFSIKETPTALDNTNAAVKVEKFFRDGQLIIRKNGVEYNATGAIIK